ncbi:hypothetical protein ACKFKF_05580 [Phormidesmis sp. 146-12]
MTYGERLKPWAIVRFVSPQWIILDRYKKRSDAEEFLKVYRRLFPNERFEIVFELPERR